MLAPQYTKEDKYASFWLGRWYFGCAWGGRNPKWFLRLMETPNGRGRALVLQTFTLAVGIGRY